MSTLTLNFEHEKTREMGGVQWFAAMEALKLIEGVINVDYTRDSTDEKKVTGTVTVETELTEEEVWAELDGLLGISLIKV